MSQGAPRNHRSQSGMMQTRFLPYSLPTIFPEVPNSFITAFMRDGTAPEAADMAEGVLAASMFDRRHEKTLSSTPALTRRSLIPPRYGSWAPAIGGRAGREGNRCTNGERGERAHLAGGCTGCT